MQTYEHTTTSVLDYKFDLAPLTNGSLDSVTGGPAKSDWLQPGEKISSYTLTISDDDLVINSSSITDDGTSVTIWRSGGNLDDKVYFVRLHVVTDSSPAREADFFMRFIPVQRK